MFDDIERFQLFYVSLGRLSGFFLKIKLSKPARLFVLIYAVIAILLKIQVFRSQIFSRKVFNEWICLLNNGKIVVIESPIVVVCCDEQHYYNMAVVFSLTLIMIYIKTIND